MATLIWARLKMDGGHQKIDKISLSSVGGEKWPAGWLANGLLGTSSITIHGRWNSIALRGHIAHLNVPRQTTCNPYNSYFIHLKGYLANRMVGKFNKCNQLLNGKCNLLNGIKFHCRNVCRSILRTLTNTKITDDFCQLFIHLIQLLAFVPRQG